MDQRYLQLPSASFVLKKLPSAFLSTTNPRPQTSRYFDSRCNFAIHSFLTGPIQGLGHPFAVAARVYGSAVGFFQRPSSSSSAHQIPVRTQTTGPQAYSRKEFHDHSGEVLSSHDEANWISTTDPLARLSTKSQFLHLLFQFVS